MHAKGNNVAQASTMVLKKNLSPNTDVCVMLLAGLCRTTATQNSYGGVKTVAMRRRNKRFFGPGERLRTAIEIDVFA